MRVLLTGGTGFIGTPVARALRAAGHDVTIVSRRPGYVPEKAIPWDGVRDVMPETDAVVNLAGTSVAEGRWTPARKADILNSRVDATRVWAEQTSPRLNFPPQSCSVRFSTAPASPEPICKRSGWCARI